MAVRQLDALSPFKGASIIHRWLAQAGARNLHVGFRPYLQEAGAGSLSFFLFVYAQITL